MILAFTWAVTAGKPNRAHEFSFVEQDGARKPTECQPVDLVVIFTRGKRPARQAFFSLFLV
eukprot:2622129-Amphidinium_carterae.1